MAQNETSWGSIYLHASFAPLKAYFYASLWNPEEDWTPLVVCTDLAGPELVDQQRASLRVLPAVQAVQLSGHLVELFVGIVELGQKLRVRPLFRGKHRQNNRLQHNTTKFWF